MVHLTDETAPAAISQASAGGNSPSSKEDRAAQAQFRRDRFGHNHPISITNPWLSRITYMAHAKGYVMVRRPGCRPFVLTEKQWLAFPYWEGQDHARKS